MTSRTTTTNSETRSPAGTGYLDDFERLQVQLHDTVAGLQHQFERWRDVFGLASSFTPPADLEETDEAFLVEIELPGIKRSDIDIAAASRRLTVTGERKEKERIGILRRRTRTVGNFRYELTLPAEFDVDGVSAGLEDGVLTVRLPKLESDRPRRIEVSA